jgi:hypothetical protein
MNPVTSTGLLATPPVSLSSRLSTPRFTSQEQAMESRSIFARSRTFDRSCVIQPMACSTCRAGDPSMHRTSVLIAQGWQPAWPLWDSLEAP